MIVESSFNFFFLRKMKIRTRLRKEWGLAFLQQPISVKYMFSSPVIWELNLLVKFRIRSKSDERKCHFSEQIFGFLAISLLFFSNLKFQENCRDSCGSSFRGMMLERAADFKIYGVL